MRLERKNGTRKGEKMKKGIDISYWQGKVDFSKVSKSVEFVILREGYRMTIDKRFLEYVQGCKGNSIPIHGVYHFCYATSTVGAEEEAASCIANMRKAGLGKDVIVFFDFEYDTVKKAAEQGITLGKSECIAFTKAFCSYVESQGYKAGVYTNLDYYQNMYDKETLDKYILWLADYTGNPDVKCTYQQYTSSGKVPGINGNVDMNYFFGEKQEEEQMRKTAQDTFNKLEYRNIPESKLTGEKWMEKSVNIGDQLSQVIGIYYPYRIDNYVKYVRSQKFYGRYMDDWYIMNPSKEELLDLLDHIHQIAEEYGIHINRKKTRIVKISSTYKFLQIKYSLTDSGKVIKRINPKRVTAMRRKLKRLAVKVKNEEISYENVENMFRSWMGGFYKLLSKEQRKNLIGLYEDLFEKSIEIVNKKMIIVDKTR